MMNGKACLPLRWQHVHGLPLHKAFALSQTHSRASIVICSLMMEIL